MSYSTLKDAYSDAIIGVIRLHDTASIPLDPANTDYQAFLAWCEEGNTPDEWNPAEATADKE